MTLIEGQPVHSFELSELFERHDQDNRMAHYRDLVLRENERVNLVSRETSSDQLDELIATSLVPLELLSPTRITSHIDIGSGGGLPAIPILLSRRIKLDPDRRPVLVERTQKKAAALRRISLDLGLRVEPIAADVMDLHLEQTFDLVTIRAVRLDSSLFRQAYQLLSQDGVLVYYSSLVFDYRNTTPVVCDIRYRLGDQLTKRGLTLICRPTRQHDPADIFSCSIT